MSTETRYLKLPYIVPGQSEKELTHNDALNILDTLIMFSVLDKDVSAEPSTPSNGDRYLLPAGATGTHWDGQGSKIAFYMDGWYFLSPQLGWQVWAIDEDCQYALTSAGWKKTGAAAPSSGWADPTGANSRSTFDPSTVNLEDLAQRVAALILDFKARGSLSA